MPGFLHFRVLLVNVSGCMLNILTFTDFGGDSLYLSQVELSMKAVNNQLKVTHLLTHAPVANPRASSYLLAALVPSMQQASVYLCVVDPGVGGQRLPVAIRQGDNWFVGPDNGLLSRVASSSQFEPFQVVFEPEKLSMTFHGRDLFAPVAARIATGDLSDLETYQGELYGVSWPDDEFSIIYRDHYGNLFTGIRAEKLSNDQRLMLKGVEIAWAERFGAAEPGKAFWYENSIGLVEIATPKGSAAKLFGSDIGDSVEVVTD